jgi:S-adenosylmethionine synthetase
MLLAWQAELMPEVVEEFQEYGFRRANDIAYRVASALTNRRLNSFYCNCQEALVDMAERSRLAITDQERDDINNESEHEQVSIDDVSEEELQQGTKL